MKQPQIDDWVDAAMAQLEYGWLGTPKRLSFICGGCFAPGEAKAGSSSIATITNKGRKLAVYCPSCKTWNFTGISES